jgi:hypothetical protein
LVENVMAAAGRRKLDSSRAARNGAPPASVPFRSGPAWRGDRAIAEHGRFDEFAVAASGMELDAPFRDDRTPR